MKSSFVFERRGILWVRTLSLTKKYELWIGDGPVMALLIEADPREKGEAVLWALHRSRRVPHPTTWEEPSLVFRASGAKRIRDFDKDTRYVLVDLESDITFVPSRNDWKDAGHVELLEKSFHIPASATPEEVGRAVDQALELCE